jgi:hypothetical protein
LIAPHIFVSDYLVALPACLLLAPLSRFCLWSSVLLLFPVTAILMIFQERLVLSANVFALALLLGAAASSANQLH